ncbi:disease resistance protein Roq1 [Cryptomeria japonica]|uniref:disease resistance protein Roq1 n=1 Tax=Cryptomeria japonica TaxID=3369 RepID=UPI0027DA9277|nr:disease resistance protein Roq1 [Cryptomeria japonica]
MASSSTPRQHESQLQNAFDQIAPYLESTSKEPWDIFINHRGIDVKHTLATAIYHKLHPMGLHVFLDVEALEPGDVMPAEIQRAINSAALHIAIFSPNYAQSPWCLAELSFMLKTGAKIIPIFYHVEPSELRWIDLGEGMYAKAFSEHGKKGKYSPEKLDEWKRALYNISFHSSYQVNKNEDEARILKNIVNCAIKAIKMVSLPVAEHPQGLDDLVEGFQSVVSKEKVQITGIVGMGGSGKTTLAKELFNRNFSSFDRCSFVFDVRDAASKYALAKKQKKLLRDLGVDHLPFDHVDEGKAVLGNRLGSHQVLIVLDDIDHVDQLNTLLPNKDNLGPQSMVIVTTRELGVLISWGLSCIYKMPGLNRSNAEKLFCWHAFLQPSPPAGFISLVEKFLKAGNGLPLSLKVFGGQLYGSNSKANWKSQLKKLSRILPTDIKQRLQVSYDALDEEEKEMFLDVACFLIGENKSRAIAVWDGSGWSGAPGLETLVNKSLVELVSDPVYSGQSPSYADKIRMHDHLRDMGREIASTHSSYRIWFPEQIKQHSLERMLIRGIQSADAFCAFKEYKYPLMRTSKRQSKLPRLSVKLQILFVRGNEFTEEFASLSEDLVWLRWENFPQRSLPSWFTLRNLSVLELSGANELEELWKSNADPPLQLRELIIFGMSKLQSLPNSVGRLKHLKKIDCYYSGGTLPEELCGLQSLEFLALSSSTMLSSLPAGFGNLLSLQHLSLQCCRLLRALPNSFKQLIHLKYLNLPGCEILSSLPAGFGDLINLQTIDLESCKQLKTLPDSFKQLIHLKSLNLKYCEKIKLRLDMLEHMRQLEYLNLSFCKELEDLPRQIINQVSLTVLDLQGCISLRGSPTNIGELGSLKSLTIESLLLPSLLNFPGRLCSLINMSIVNSDSETTFDAGAASSLEILKKKDLEDCKQVSRMLISNDCCPSLETLEIWWNHHLMEIETLPMSLKILDICNCKVLKNIRCIGNLANLKKLEISDCPEIDELPSFLYLASLKKFRISDCPKVEKIEGLEHCKSLETLKIGLKVPGIPSLEKVERLERLELECNTISALKPCIQSMKECPSEMEIQGSVINFVKPTVNSLGFPGITVTEMEAGSDLLKIRDSAYILYYDEKRKVVYIGLFCHNAGCCAYNYATIFTGKKAMVVTGQEGRVVEAFYQLFALLE